MSGRKVCPKCGSTNVKHTEDRTQIVSYSMHAPVYKKVWKCGACGEKFE
ncbi:MAG: hypothetical protein ACFFCQ_07455 [Promethearchaeota archaeon]